MCVVCMLFLSRMFIFVYRVYALVDLTVESSFLHDKYFMNVSAQWNIIEQSIVYILFE